MQAAWAGISLSGYRALSGSARPTGYRLTRRTIPRRCPSPAGGSGVLGDALLVAAGAVGLQRVGRDAQFLAHSPEQAGDVGVEGGLAQAFAADQVLAGLRGGQGLAVDQQALANSSCTRQTVWIIAWTFGLRLCDWSIM